MKNSKIEWCDHTFNPWIGCTKVSPGCANCYAAAQDHRWGHESWGPGKPRRRTSGAYWKQPLQWDREEAGMKVSHEDFVANVRPRVFCASMADWLDEEVPIEWLTDLLDLIRRTPHLDWLLLTKRPENWRNRLVAAMANATVRCMDNTRSWCEAWVNYSIPHRNVWIGTTVEDQERADQRIPALLNIPAKALFLSCEPLLGPVNIHAGVKRPKGYRGYFDWVICGGESGPGARPMDPVWARSLRNQCEIAGVPFFFKQWGDWLGAGQTGAEQDGHPNALFNPHDSPIRVGKGPAGRLLDGVEYSAFPIF